MSNVIISLRCENICELASYHIIDKTSFYYANTFGNEVVKRAMDQMYIHFIKTVDKSCKDAKDLFMIQEVHDA
jgi:hypothetical protein